jgi:hypothetical protein
MKINKNMKLINVYTTRAPLINAVVLRVSPVTL